MYEIGFFGILVPWKMLICMIVATVFIVPCRAQPQTVKMTPINEFCSWLFADCPEINQKNMPTMDPTEPLSLSLIFYPARLLYIDELEKR